MVVFSDGETSLNGQVGQLSSIVVWSQGNVVVEKDVGDKTNNEAEYLGIIEALEWLLKNVPGEKNVVLSDSQFVLNQLMHQYHFREKHLRPYAEKAWNLLIELQNTTLKWIPRERNKAGLYIDAKNGRGIYQPFLFKKNPTLVR